MQTIFGIIIGFISLTILIVVHEFGHFLAAIRNGVTVKEFGIGFPPRLIAWQKIGRTWRRLAKTPDTTSPDTLSPVFTADPKTNPKTDPKLKSKSPPTSAQSAPSHSIQPNSNPSGLIFSINALPIGGFCSMDGENASSTTPGTFGAASFWAKTKILFAGVTFNLLFAAILLTSLAFAGLPQFLPNQFNIPSDQTITYATITIQSVQPSSPAALAGLQPGDHLTHLNDQPLTSLFDINKITRQIPDQPLKITYRRDHQTHHTTATLNPTSAPFLFGITSDQQGITTARHGLTAPIVGVVTTAQLTAETFKGLGTMLAQLTTGLINQFHPNNQTRQHAREQIDTVGKSVSGPIGIIGNIFPAASTSLTDILLLSAIISVSLACMNVLPIPALDGGRWLLIALYKLRKKPLDQSTEERIVGRAFLALISLILLITILDIIKLF